MQKAIAKFNYYWMLKRSIPKPLSDIFEQHIGNVKVAILTWPIGNFTKKPKSRQKVATIEG
jgi:hypothetical protein